MAIQKVTGEIIENNLLRSASLAFNTDLLYIDVVNDRIGINTSAPGTSLDVTGSARVTGDMTVQGNLDVEGQTSIIDTVNLEVEDPILLLGRNNSGSDIDLGIMMNRGAGINNAVFYWNEGEDAFKMVMSTSADSTTAITDSAYAPLQVGKITVDQEIEITDNEIRTTTSNTNLELSTAGSGTVLLSNLSIAGDGATVTGILDEDAMGSDSAVKLATQQSIKAYVDAQIAGTSSTGDITFVGSSIVSPSNADITLEPGGTGNVVAGSVTISDNEIFSNVSNADLALSASGSGTVSINGLKFPTSDGSAGYHLQTDGSGNLSWVAGGSANVYGHQVELGDYSDSSTQDGALLTGLGSSVSVTDAVDALNEALLNVQNDTFVRSVSFVSDSTAGGLNLAVTLTITAEGDANRYTINWGDGNTTTATSDATPSHTYSDSANSPYDVTVTAFHADRVEEGSAGSEASSTRVDYITAYTVNPVTAFELYAASSGGSALTGNNLWAVEGGTRYLRNTTTNTSGATVAYSMAWGDGSSADAIANDSASGGVSGTRLAHTWQQGTNSSTGRDTLTLSLTTHSTCNPALLPVTGTLTVKVYDDAPSAPAHLGAKTIAMNAVVGTTPKLCHGFSENVSGSPTYSAGDSVNRVTSVDPVRTANQSTFAYNAASGTLNAYVNGSVSGAISLDGNDNSGTNSDLILQSESDFQLLDASGTAVAFNSSIYYPTLYSGFKAIVSKATSGISTGVNSFQLRHTLGNSNVLEFVKDNITATPTTTIGTVAQGTAGTFRYISGIPYYNSGSPTVTVTGTTVANFTGQTYQDTSSPHEVIGATTSEGSGNVLATNPTTFTYANIDGGSTMLNGGIPVANTGVSSAYTLGAVTCPLYASSRATVQTIKARTKNTNGSGGYSEAATKIQLFTQTPSGLNNEQGGITVADALGATHDDDALRIYDFSSATTDNPTVDDSSNLNYYTNDLFTGNKTIAGTREAVTRFGSITHNAINYSSGFLPAGPNLSTGRSGSQYYTLVFRRTTMANFDITMTGTVSGMWIAAPGTAIDDSSGLNGWLDCSTAYAGSGVPGSDTGNGGNGSDGCAYNSGDRVLDGTGYSSQEFTFTLGTENASNARNNCILIRIKLEAGDSITALAID